MKFVRRLLGSVSSIALFLSGVSGATANVPADNPELATQPSGVADFDKSRRTGDLLVKLILSGGQLTERSIETDLQYMLVDLTPEQVIKLPLLMGDIRTLGLRPEIEVAAAETLIRIVGKASGTVLTKNQAKLIVGDVFDQFVNPTKIANNLSPPARPVGGRTIHDIQLAQEAGISAPEQLETLRPLMAPEELETQFEPGAGYQL